MKHLLTAMLSALLFAAAAAPVGAQDFPSRPLRIIVPYPPGGGTDRVARIIGEKLAEQMSQPVVIDNRAGAGGVVGTEASARAAPDGYTMVLGSTATHAVNPSLYSKPGYDPIADFVAISPLATTPAILVVNASLQVSSLQELLAMLRAPRPGVSMTFASAGAGSLQHMAGELFKSMTKADILHVPYKGAAPAMTDLLAGHVTMAFDTMPSAMPHVRAGKLKALGTTYLTRAPLAPEIPTVAEQGFPGFETDSWYGVIAPASMPKDIVERIAAAVNRALDDPATQRNLADRGIEKIGGTSARLGEHIRAEIAKYAKIVRDSGMQID